MNTDLNGLPKINRISFKDAVLLSGILLLAFGVLGVIIACIVEYIQNI